MSAMSKAPVPPQLEVNLPDVELRDLADEDKTVYKWISRAKAGNFDDAASNVDEEEEKEKEGLLENVNKTSMTYLAKQKAQLE